LCDRRLLCHLQAKTRADGGITGFVDYLADSADPLAAGADQIRNVVNYGNTLNRNDLPDFALVTG
jgi:hypothetical protein